MAEIAAEMCFSFNAEKKAENAFKALEPELCGRHEKRANTVANIKKNILAFTISAQDLSAMKTSMNSYAKSIALIKEFSETEQ